MNIDDIKVLNKVNTPSYVVDEDLITRNLLRLDEVQKKSGCKILLALKGFSMYSLFSLVGKYLYGITSSSLNEALLGKKYMNKEVHIYAPAYRDVEFDQIVSVCDHIVFNSPSQYKRFIGKVRDENRNIQVGIRVNPEYSEVKTDIYDPCGKYSRLGTTFSSFDESIISEIDGLHFHTMCEQQFDVLERTFYVFEKKFGKYLYDLKWLNLGGGQHISSDHYDIDGLVKLVKYIKDKYGVEVYMEPGEAIALNTGFLVASVLDIVKNDMEIAILDTSASCHMPDVIEMPYRPHIIGSDLPNKKEYTYRLGGMTCLAGDIIGDYSFDKPLAPGDKLIFTDMAHYTMVKNNTFNGVNLPDIAIKRKGDIEVVKTFGFEDYERRL